MRKSTYQKQKEQIERLQHELRLVCTDPTCIEALLIASRERSAVNAENTQKYYKKSAVGLIEQIQEAGKHLTLDDIDADTKYILENLLTPPDDYNPFPVWP